MSRDPGSFQRRICDPDVQSVLRLRLQLEENGSFTTNLLVCGVISEGTFCDWADGRVTNQEKVNALINKLQISDEEKLSKFFMIFTEHHHKNQEFLSRVTGELTRIGSNLKFKVDTATKINHDFWNKMLCHIASGESGTEICSSVVDQSRLQKQNWKGEVIYNETAETQVTKPQTVRLEILEKNHLEL